MKAHIFWTICILSGAAHLLKAQTLEIAQLEDSLQEITDDKQRAKVLSQLTWKLRDSDLKKALNYGIRSLKLIKKSNYQAINAQTNNYVGIIYRNLSDYNNATTYYYKALKAAQDNQQDLQVAYAHNNIGEIFKYQNKPKDSEKNIRSAIKTFIKIKDKGGEAYGYLRLGEILQLQSKYPAALQAYQKAVAIRLKLPKQARLDVVYNRIGSLFIQQKRYQQALEYLRKAMAANLRNQVKGTGIYAIEVNIAKVYIHQNKPDKAIELAQKTLDNVTQIPSKPLMSASLKLLYEAYALKKNHVKAYEYQLEYIKITQQFLSIQSKYRLTVLESIQKLEKKQNEIELKSKDLALLQKQQSEAILRRNLVYALAGGILLLLGFLFVLVRSNRSKQKANQLLQVKNEQIDRKNQDITASITYAQRIQEAMLYVEDELKKVLPDHFILFQPRDIVSGDFYWIEQDEGKIFMVAADYTGHGVPGAFMTMLGTQALSDIVIQNKVHSPELILFHLDIILSRTLKSKNTLLRDGMDITVCVIDSKARELSFAGAKNSLILVQNDQVKEIKGDIISINGHRQENSFFDIQFHLHTIDISTSTTFYIYSDGFQDQFGGAKGRKFMKKRFRELLLKVASHPVATQKQMLETTLSHWMEGHEQVDDILVMGIKV